MKCGNSVVNSSLTSIDLPDISVAKVFATLIIALSTIGELLALNSHAFGFLDISDAVSGGILDFDVSLTNYEPRRYHVDSVKSNDASVLLREMADDCPIDISAYAVNCSCSSMRSLNYYTHKRHIQSLHLVLSINQTTAKASKTGQARM